MALRLSKGDRGWYRMTTMLNKIVSLALRVTGIARMMAVPGADEELAVAEVIEFYVPRSFQKSVKRACELQRGKVIEFCPRTKKSA